MFGLLFPTLIETQQQGLTSVFVRMSLRASHTWCNRLKDQLILIRPPMASGGIYEVNEDSMDILFGPGQYGEKWLKKGIADRTGHDYLFHYMTNPAVSGPFLINMRAHTTANLNRICAELNRVMLPAMATLSKTLAGNYNRIPKNLYSEF